MMFRIVIVNWNSWKKTEDCLSSIQKYINLSYLEKVVVVDNNSQDKPLFSTENINIPLEIIYNNQNLGFGTACNQGAKNTSSDYILFLNPDTIFIEDSLPLVQHIFISNAQVGVVGAALIDESGKISRSCAILPKPIHFWNKLLGLTNINSHLFPGVEMDYWDHSQSSDVGHVMGAFYAIRTNLFQGLKGFDESFFVYFEDLDLSKRVHDLGYKIFFTTETKVFHEGGGTSKSIKAKRLFYSQKERIRYAKKHFSSFSATAIALGILFIEPIIRSLFLLSKKDTSGLSELKKAYAMLFSNAKELLYTSPKQKQP